jgi:hypothetical protein
VLKRRLIGESLESIAKNFTESFQSIGRTYPDFAGKACEK